MRSPNEVVAEDARLLVDALGGVLDPLCGSTLLITGASGFLGSYFLDVVEHLNRVNPGSPCHVIGVDNFGTGTHERVSHLRDNENFRFVERDVVQGLPDDAQADWIIHAASIASPVRYRQQPLRTIDVNVQGTRNVLEVARRGVRGMVHFSSSEVYGDPSDDSIPTQESYPGLVSFTGPRACYDESKRLGETLCRIYAAQFGVPVAIVRPFNVYGPGQRLDDGRAVPDFLSAALRNEPLVLFSDGRATRSFCYIRDFVDCVLRLLVRCPAGEYFNVGNDHEVSIRVLAETIAKIASAPPLPVTCSASEDPDYLTDNPHRRCPDIGKVTAYLGWRPSVGLAEGLERTLRSYRG